MCDEIKRGLKLNCIVGSQGLKSSYREKGIMLQPLQLLCLKP